MGSAAKLTGVGASEGVAVGPVYAHVGGKLEPERKRIPDDSVEQELNRFHRAVEKVVRRLSETVEDLRESGS